MKTVKTSASWKKQLLGKLSDLGRKEPFIMGTLVKIHRRCGNPNCTCAQEGGAKHPAHLLTTKVKAKTQAIYIPVDMVEEVRAWCRQYRALKADLQEGSMCCEQIIRLHVKEKRASKRTPPQSK